MYKYENPTEQRLKQQSISINVWSIIDLFIITEGLSSWQKSRV